MEQEMLDNWKQAGKLAGTVRDYGASLIKVDASLLEVTQKVEQKIKELGGEPAFPPQISLNRTAAHYCAHPNDETRFAQGDVVKIDVGVHINGCIGDTARTVDLGDNKELIQASRDALYAALNTVRPGITLTEIGAAIQDAIEKYEGLLPVRNLSGHGLGQFIIHTSPSIPNYDSGDSQTLHEGQTIAIEPFASNGAGMIYESGTSTIFSLVDKRPVRSPDTRKILSYIEKQFGTLPFTTRWLMPKFNLFQVRVALTQLLNSGIIRGYPPLVDKKEGALVSQAEHSVIVMDKPIITTRIDDY